MTTKELTVNIQYEIDEAVKQEIAALRQLVSDLKEDGGRLNDYVDHTFSCKYNRDNEDEDCDCGLKEVITKHAALMEKIEKAGI